jgi:hypothetical protein
MEINWTPKKVTCYFIRQYRAALVIRSIRKPLSFALYQTWKAVDAEEEERDG